MSNFKKRMESYRRHPGSFLLFLLVMLSALATFVVLLFLIAMVTTALTRKLSDRIVNYDVE